MVSNGFLPFSDSGFTHFHDVLAHLKDYLSIDKSIFDLAGANFRLAFKIYDDPKLGTVPDIKAALESYFKESITALDRIVFEPSIVRGLEYYTGPVFECELLIPTTDDDGKPARFGSVGGGGRYDDLVARFTGQQVPATGFSIGVSRLYDALQKAKLTKESATLAPVVVLVMDKNRQGDYWRMVQELRAAKHPITGDPIRAEMYVGTAGMKAQMKYADKRGSPLVIIQGSNERELKQVQIKDLRLGAELAAHISSREEYASQRLAQVMAPDSGPEFVAAVKTALAR